MKLSENILQNLFLNYIAAHPSTLSTIRSFGRFCNQFSERSHFLPGQRGSCITTVELSETILQNLGNDLMAESVQQLHYMYEYEELLALALFARSHYCLP